MNESPKTPNKTPKPVRRSAGYRLPIDLLDEIRRHAQVDMRSANSEVEALLRLALEVRARQVNRFFG